MPSAGLLPPPTLPSQPTAEDADRLLPASRLGPTYPSDSILVTTEPCSLPSLYSLCDAEASCVSTKGKGKGQAQQDGRCLLLLVPVAEGSLDAVAVTAQHMQGSSQICLPFPRPSGAAATASPPPVLPSSVSLVFPSGPGLMLTLHSWETKSTLHMQLPDSGLFTRQHPESGVSPSAMR